MSGFVWRSPATPRELELSCQARDLDVGDVVLLYTSTKVLSLQGSIVGSKWEDTVETGTPVFALLTYRRWYDKDRIDLSFLCSSGSKVIEVIEPMFLASRAFVRIARRR